MLAEINENLIRNDLKDLERSEHLAERKRLYLLKHPETKQGAQGGGRNSKGTRRKTETADSAVSVAFADDTAAKTGQSVRTVREDVQVAESIPEDVLDHHVGVGRFNAAMTAISTARRSTVTRSRASRSDTENPGV